MELTNSSTLGVTPHETRQEYAEINPQHEYANGQSKYKEWRTKCHSIDCARNTFLLLQKHLTSGTELILIGWKIIPNEE